MKKALDGALQIGKEMAAHNRVVAPMILFLHDYTKKALEMLENGDDQVPFSNDANEPTHTNSNELEQKHKRISRDKGKGRGRSNSINITTTVCAAAAIATSGIQR